MSRDDEDDDPSRYPKRAGFGREPRKRQPESDPQNEPTTFRPAPKKKGSTTRPSRTESERDRLPAGPGWMERILFGRVSSGQLARFCRQFSAYLDAGVDIGKALSGLEQQFAGTALGPVVSRVKNGVRQGDALGDTVEREPQAFDSLFVSMIKVAEARG